MKRTAWGFLWEDHERAGRWRWVIWSGGVQIRRARRDYASARSARQALYRVGRALGLEIKRVTKG